MIDQYVNRNFHTKPMTKGEINTLDKRISEIAGIMEVCDEDDILDNLELELTVLIEILEDSMKATRIRESGLKAV